MFSKLKWGAALLTLFRARARRDVGVPNRGRRSRIVSDAAPKMTKGGPLETSVLRAGPSPRPAMLDAPGAGELAATFNRKPLITQYSVRSFWKKIEVFWYFLGSFLEAFWNFLESFLKEMERDSAAADTGVQRKIGSSYTSCDPRSQDGRLPSPCAAGAPAGIGAASP